MRVASFLNRADGIATSALTPLQPVFLLILRLYVSWQFLKSGWLKLQDWDTTQVLFQEEYRVPLLAPAVASVVGTFGEIVFPVLLIAGLMGRYAALGLSAVNVMAVVAYAHVLLSPGFEGAIAQHYLWGTMLAMLLVFGPGKWSADESLTPTVGRACD